MKNKISSSQGSEKGALETKNKPIEVQKTSSTKFRSLFFWILVLGGLLVAGYFALRMSGREIKIPTKEIVASSTVQEAPVKELSDKERLNVLEDQVKALTKKVEQYSNYEKELVGVVGEISALNARLNIIETHVSRVSGMEESAMGTMAETFNEKEKKTGGALQRIEARLNNLENSLNLREKLGKNGFAVLTSYSALQNAVLAGHVYGEQLNSFIEQYPFQDEIFQEAIKDLKPYSQQGIVTATQLYLAFPNLADEMIKAGRPAPKTMWQEIENKIFDLVSIRPINPEDTSKEDLDSRLVEMEVFLGRGDVVQALDLFDKLPPAVQEVGQSWAESARAYIRAEQAIRKLEALVFWRALGRVPVASEKRTFQEKTNSSGEAKGNI